MVRKKENLIRLLNQYLNIAVIMAFANGVKEIGLLVIEKEGACMKIASKEV